MPSPFPGMDPYLEDPTIWPSFHGRFIADLQDFLNRTIRPKYVATIEQRIYLANDFDDEPFDRIPDLMVHTKDRQAWTQSAFQTDEIESPQRVLLESPRRRKQTSLSIRLKASKVPVTVIEIVSPSNKRKGSGSRKSFLRKKRDITASLTHWVEIDLLRNGRVTFTRPSGLTGDYFAYISKSIRADNRERRYWGFGLERPMPVIGIPLTGRDPDASMPLQKVFESSYQIGGFDALIDYSADPDSPLPASRKAWATKLLKAAKLR